MEAKLNLKFEDEIYKKYYPLVYSTCRRFLYKQDFLEDAIQSVFLLYLKKEDSLHANLSSWFYWASVNICKVVNSDIKKQLDNLSKLNEYAEQKAKSKSIEESSINLGGALDKLPKKKREMLLMRYYENLSYREIGTYFKCKENSVRMTIERTVLFLKEEVKKKEYVTSVLISDLFCLDSAATLNPDKFILQNSLFQQSLIKGVQKMYFITKIKSALILCLCFIIPVATFLIAEDKIMKESKPKDEVQRQPELKDLEIFGTVVYSDSRLGLEYYYLEIEEKQLVSLPKKIGDKEIDLNQFKDKQVVVKGKGTSGTGSSGKMVVLKQLLSIKLKDIVLDSEKILAETGEITIEGTIEEGDYCFKLFLPNKISGYNLFEPKEKNSNIKLKDWINKSVKVIGKLKVYPAGSMGGWPTFESIKEIKSIEENANINKELVPSKELKSTPELKDITIVGVLTTEIFSDITYGIGRQPTQAELDDFKWYLMKEGGGLLTVLPHKGKPKDFEYKKLEGELVNLKGKGFDEMTNSIETKHLGTNGIGSSSQLKLGKEMLVTRVVSIVSMEIYTPTKNSSELKPVTTEKAVKESEIKPIEEKAKLKVEPEKLPVKHISTFDKNLNKVIERNTYPSMIIEGKVFDCGGGSFLIRIAPYKGIIWDAQKEKDSKIKLADWLNKNVVISAIVDERVIQKGEDAENPDNLVGGKATKITNDAGEIELIIDGSLKIIESINEIKLSVPPENQKAIQPAKKSDLE